ncbi:Arv1 protein [Arabidopsis suecica]|uniref:Protein ARV n=1 Tax=Arabidopsis suecica TaxID=45249 RepID=A0A8T2EAY8_ARASU|nr:Arv1 protein [Arabidopsis suecica]
MAREKKTCVECGHKVKSLFIQYSPGNFRLMKCENCEEVADEYVECELLIIFIDLILHKTKAYRHLLYNVVNQESANVQVLVNVLSANFTFVFSFAFAAKLMLVMPRGKEILLTILISSYVKIFLFAMPVWEFPVSVIFIVDMLVLTSNAVALKVMTESATSRCLAVCFIAHSIRFLVDQISGHLGSVM